jgi:hypothetical protein
MSPLPEYKTACRTISGEIKQIILWKGKFDEIAVVHEHRDAVKICDALNGVGETWNWIPCAERLPDDDIEVLVLTRQQHLHVAVHDDGRWHPRDLGPGVRLSQNTITHWIDPIYPETK